MSASSAFDVNTAAAMAHLRGWVGRQAVSVGSGECERGHGGGGRAHHGKRTAGQRAEGATVEERRRVPWEAAAAAGSHTVLHSWDGARPVMRMRVPLCWVACMDGDVAVPCSRRLHCAWASPPAPQVEEPHQRQTEHALGAILRCAALSAPIPTRQGQETRYACLRACVPTYHTVMKMAKMKSSQPPRPQRLHVQHWQQGRVWRRPVVGGACVH